MTIKQYVRKKGYTVETTIDKPFRVMTVDVGFINADGEDDETEFDVYSFNTQELSELFHVFCEENGCKENNVTSITVVRTAASMNELQELEVKSA